MKLSKNFKLSEFMISRSHPELLINVHIPPHYKWNLFKLATIHMQTIRDFLKKPVYITSGFRTQELNKRIGGRKNSQHLFGEAADWVVLNKDSSVDQGAMEEGAVFVKTHLWPAVGEHIIYREKNGDIAFVHTSLPDPRFVQRFYTIRNK